GATTREATALREQVNSLEQSVQAMRTAPNEAARRVAMREVETNAAAYNELIKTNPLTRGRVAELTVEGGRVAELDASAGRLTTFSSAPGRVAEVSTALESKGGQVA